MKKKYKPLVKLIVIVFLLPTLCVQARVVDTTVTLPNGTTTQGSCTLTECTTTGGDTYQRNPDTPATDYTLIGAPNSSSNSATPQTSPDSSTSDQSPSTTESPAATATTTTPAGGVNSDPSLSSSNASTSAGPDGGETDITSGSESPQNTETTSVLTPEQTEAALEEASQQALNQETRTDEQIAADNQAAIEQAAIEQAAGVNTDTSTNNILGIQNNQLRTGTVDMDTIPRVLVSIINVLLGVAGTISIVALIYYAIQMQINSGITGDSSGVDNAKKGMKGAILGFIVAILAWFIVIRFIEILSSVS